MQATPRSVALAIIHSATFQYASNSANALIQRLHLAAMLVAQDTGIAAAAGTRVRESRVFAIQDGDTFALPGGDEAHVKTVRPGRRAREGAAVLLRISLA